MRPTARTSRARDRTHGAPRTAATSCVAVPRATSAPALCATAALLIAGCAGSKHDTDIAATTPEAAIARPAVDLAGLGLEVRGWVVDNRDSRLARLLAAHEADTALSEPADAAWTSCGLRIIDVPVDDLAPLYARLATGPEQRMWLGQTPQWTQAYTAAEARRSTGVRMPEGELLLEPGTLRLLVRAWVERTIAPGPASEAELASADPTANLGPARSSEVRRLRVDILPQNRERSDDELTLEPIDPTRPLETGLVFERLRSTWTSDGTRALLIVPAPPEEDWQALARVVGPVDDSGDQVGPFGAPLPTLGEALLGTGREGYRIVLVLIPRTSVESPTRR